MDVDDSATCTDSMNEKGPFPVPSELTSRSIVHYSPTGSALFFTPSRMTSSVFMTPPTSGLKPEERTASKIHDGFEGPPKFDLPWSWETPDHADSEGKRWRIPQVAPLFWTESQKVEEKRLDVITRLLSMDSYEILHRILEFLPVWELCQFAAVSRSWDCALKRDKDARTRRKTFPAMMKRTLKFQGENLTPNFTGRVLDSQQESRLALGSIQNQSQSTKKPDIGLASKTSPFPFGIYGKHRPCPKCYSSARESPTVTQCVSCNYSFCVHCFKPWSSEHNCQSETNEFVDTKLEGYEYAIGSKESKKRLRRL